MQSADMRPNLSAFFLYFQVSVCFISNLFYVNNMVNLISVEFKVHVFLQDS